METRLQTTGFGSRCKTTIFICPVCGSSNIRKVGTFYGKCDRCKATFSWKSKERSVSSY